MLRSIMLITEIASVRIMDSGMKKEETKWIKPNCRHINLFIVCSFVLTIEEYALTSETTLPKLRQFTCQVNILLTRKLVLQQLWMDGRFGIVSAFESWFNFLKVCLQYLQTLFHVRFSNFPKLGHEVDVGHATLCRELYRYRYEYLSINIQVQYAQCNYSLYDIIIFRGWEWGGLGHLAVSS